MYLFRTPQAGFHRDANGTDRDWEMKAPARCDQYERVRMVRRYMIRRNAGDQESAMIFPGPVCQTDA